MKESVSRSLTVFIDVNCERSIILSFVITMVICINVGCGNKSGKSSQKKESVVKFSRVPKFVLTEGEVLEELTTRRQAWISAISRADLTDDNLENERVCSRHFFVWPSCQTVGPMHVYMWKG